MIGGGRIRSSSPPLGPPAPLLVGVGAPGEPPDALQREDDVLLVAVLVHDMVLAGARVVLLHVA
eukprot:1018111-Prorocentrum_minimum.AAC.1